jgi:nucleoside-triphosphatase
MALSTNNILITGLPGIGKTTLIKKLSEALSDFHPVGFYTEEIREQGIRKGFELTSLDGKKGILSHTDIKSPYKVGKYNVDIKGFDDFLDSVPFFELFTRIIIIDEIGKMECLSKKFRRLLEDVLTSEKIVIATIALKGGGIIEKTKKRDDVRIFEMKLDNRESLLEEILEEVKRVTCE